MSENCFETAPIGTVQNLNLVHEAFDLGNNSKAENKAKLILITDPICSTAWSFEGELKRLSLEYGHALDLKVIMGGLLPSWVDFDRGGISNASDVFCHWKDVGDHFEVPLSAEVWKRDPLSSSFPSSKAVICAFRQSNSLGFEMLRALREAVFIHDRNISKLDIIISIAEEIKLDMEVFLTDFENSASSILEQQIEYSKKLGVKLLPTVLFAKADSSEVYKLEANLDYSCLESMVHQVLPDVTKEHYDTSLFSLINRFKGLSTKELSILTQDTRLRTEQKMNQLKHLGLVDLLEFSTGNFWIKKG